MSQTQSASLNRAATLELGRRVLRIEAEAILALIDRIDGSFTAAVELILAAGGRVIVSGIGKSGHIARKIAATLSSTGTPAYFVHAAEANHGDLGMIARDDVLIALSNSGEAEDLLSIVPLIKRRGGKLIAITGNAYSSLAREADVHLTVASPRKPARSTSPPPPARLPRWPSATRWRWPCSTRAASRLRISPTRIPVARWVVACSPCPRRDA